MNLASDTWLPALTDALREFSDAASDFESLLACIARATSKLLRAQCSVGLASERREAWWKTAQAGSSGAAPLLANAPNADPNLVKVLETSRPWIATPNAAYFALRSGNRAVGVVFALREEGSPTFDKHDLEIGAHLAQAAGIVLGHIELRNGTQRELWERQRMADRLRVLAQASRDFATAPDRRKLSEMVARTVGEQLGELCSVRLLSPDGEWLRAEDASIYHPDPSVAAGFREVMVNRAMHVSEGMSASVIATKQSKIVSVPMPDALQPQVVAEYHESLKRLRITSVVLVPLLARSRCVGVLALSRQAASKPFDSDDLRLAEDLADRAGLAIENLELVADLERRVADNKKAEEKFAGLLESAPDAILIIDQVGKIVLINAQTESLFGYARSELLGQSVELLVPSQFKARHPQLRATYFQAPRVRHAMAAGLDLFGLRKDGSQFAAEINLSPISTPEGQLVTAVIRDVTERKRLEEARARTLELETMNRRAQEANRLKSEFLANMSHELRTPLNAIIGFSALMHAGKVGPLSSKQVDYLGDILASSRHLLQLINDVLDLAKIEAGRVEIRASETDLSRLVGEVRDIVRGLAGEKRIQLKIEVAPGLGEVVTDARLLKQVLYNYVSNAIKFTPERGCVEIRVEPSPEETFSVHVKDTGIGIKPEDMSRLFVEFQQLDSGAAKRYPGTGLGLAITKRVVEAQGGNVSVLSAVGEGSTFSATLPRKPRSRAGEEQRDGE